MTVDAERLRRFYDRVGRWQDSQSFYERPAVEALVQHGAFGEARRVVEVGCGTGRLAARLLRNHCPPSTRYAAVELSPVMADLARDRLRPFAHRAEVQVRPAPPLPFADDTADCVVAAYVLDLMPKADVNALLAEAARVLRPGGRLCTCGLAPGTTPLTRAVSRLWRGIHAAAPLAVGGCRPLSVRPLLPGTGLRALHHETVSAWGVPSEVLVAECLRRDARESPRRRSTFEGGDRNE